MKIVELINTNEKQMYWRTLKLEVLKRDWIDLGLTKWNKGKKKKTSTKKPRKGWINSKE